jgi:predicted ArsR family transcriptional regulator
VLQQTRQQILDYIRWKGHATVKELSVHLELTPTAIRQHLAVLERDGYAVAHEMRGHVGRPALVYSLTPSGDALYPKRYDELAAALITTARELMGSESSLRLLKGVATRLAEQYAHRLEGRPRAQRLQETAAILAERGNLIETDWSGDDFLVHTYTCPYRSVALNNSIVCALDVDFVRQLAGADARLSTSLLRGDASCTFRIRR